MEIGTMSAAELAQSFANQNQDTQSTQQTQNQQVQQHIPVEITGKSAEELAKEFQNGIQTTTNSGEQKTPEQLAEEAKVKAENEVKVDEKPKTKLDDSFKNGLDLLFKEQKLNPYSDGTEAGYIIPETFEEVLELIEDNKKSWVESAKTADRQELLDEVLSTKSPAWQFLIKNAELYKDPAELVPLLTAVQNQVLLFLRCF